MRFFCISQPWLEATNTALAKACSSRGIEMVLVSPQTFCNAPGSAPVSGDLLYRAATDAPSDRLEKLLWHRGVAAFYEEPYFECLYQGILFQKSGIVMPRTIHAVSRDRATLQRQIAPLGDFPLVVKVAGNEGGNGVMRVDSFAALFSLLDHIGDAPQIMAYFEHVVAYRLIVVGERVIATEARYSGPGDFRSKSAGSGSLGAVTAPPQAIEMALKAARLMRVEFGGIDILENAERELVLAELNFPCYFADQQHASGVDIAGAMIDQLIVKARRIGSRNSNANATTPAQNSETCLTLS